ncbi:MAG: HD-GYP domain-containing protein [Planctomycetota bacterium]
MTRNPLARARLVGALFGTLKLMQMYGRGHSATAEAVANLQASVREAEGEEREIVLGVRGSRLLVNGQTMRATECGALAVGYVVEEWRRRGIAAVRLNPEVTVADLEAFASAFLELDLTRPGPAGRLVASLGAAGAHGILVEPLDETEEEPVLMMERRESAMRSYLSGLRAFREVLRGDGVADSTKLRRARRSIQALVDSFLEDETAVLALAQIRSHDVKLFHHSLNVCVYALAIGQRVGMSRRQLSELGLAALFHDVGKTVAVADAKPSAAEGVRATWRTLRGHPLRGAMTLLRGATAQEGILKASIAAYEHHVQFDRGGFPKIEHEPHAISRIVAIADCFEALTSARSYRQVPYSSQDAFALMWSKAGTIFDPLFLKVFVNALGVYPAGSVVRLSTGEIGIVTAPPTDGTLADRPKVRVVLASDGSLPPDAVVDLAERGPDGDFVRSVAAALPAREVFDTVGDFISAL